MNVTMYWDNASTNDVEADWHSIQKADTMARMSGSHQISSDLSPEISFWNVNDSERRRPLFQWKCDDIPH